MNYNLENFDEFLEKKLIDAGRNYWLNNTLTPFDYEGLGRWHTIAKDKEFFHIFIILNPRKENEIFSCQCGCVRNTYMCPHIIAGLFELREFFISGKNIPFEDQMEEEALKLRQIKEVEQFKELFNRFSKEDVNNVIIDYIVHQKGSDNTLIEEIITKTGIDIAGINQAEVLKFMKPVNELVKKAEIKYSQNEFAETFFALQSIIEEITKLMVKIDFMKIKDDEYFADKFDDETPVYFIGRKKA